MPCPAPDCHCTIPPPAHFLVTQRLTSKLLVGGHHSVIFSTRSGDTENLWKQIYRSEPGKVSGVYRDDGRRWNEVERPAHRERLGITNMEVIRMSVATIRSGQRKAKGRSGADHPGPSWREHASLSGDGRYVAFVSTQSGSMNIWQRDLRQARRRIWPARPLRSGFPSSMYPAAKPHFRPLKKAVG